MARRVNKDQLLTFDKDFISSYVLSDPASLSFCDTGLSHEIQQGGLPMVHMTHNCHNWRTNRQIFRTLRGAIFDRSGLFEGDKTRNQVKLFTESFDSFLLEGVKIHAVLDLAFKEEGLYRIVDWKTGKREGADSTLQLTCYALYGMGKWDAPLEQIRVIEYNLYGDKMVESDLAPGDIESLKAYVNGSVTDMRRLLSDIEGNKAEEGDFKGTTDAKQCARCNFGKLCPVKVEDS